MKAATTEYFSYILSNSSPDIWLYSKNGGAEGVVSLTAAAWCCSSPHTWWELWCCSARGIYIRTSDSGSRSGGTSGTCRSTPTSETFSSPRTQTSQHKDGRQHQILYFKLYWVICANSQSCGWSEERDLEPPPGAPLRWVTSSPCSSPYETFYCN